MINVTSKDRCPCGSGKEYRKCHSPKRDMSDRNPWRGPGFPQQVYLGHNETFDGFQFDKGRKGEFVLCRREDRIPIARFICVDTTILVCKAIVRSISLSVDDRIIRYCGSVEIQGQPQGSIPIIIGCLDSQFLDSFETDLSGVPISYTKGNWVVFVGEDDNPMGRIAKQPQWFRFFWGSGFLIELQSPGEINFQLTAQSRSYNVFTLVLPFGELEVSYPGISVGHDLVTCQLELEDESVSWDLVLHREWFSEKRRSRLDSQVFSGYEQGAGGKFQDFGSGIRKHFLKPKKLRIAMSLPEHSCTMGKFSNILENALRTISEDGVFSFGDEDKRVLEADFRDHVLTILKGSGYFAFAEPSRRAGFVDVLLRKDNLEAIIEFKVWGRRNYKSVIGQVLKYGTPWTTEYATVMINTNKATIVDRFIGNAKSAPGYKYVTVHESAVGPLTKLVSCHFHAHWEKQIAVTHFIINAAKL
ncbi:MAG: SEC-C domain-containing protein [Thermodesulfobacteriota bacterium]